GPGSDGRGDGRVLAEDHLDHAAGVERIELGAGGIALLGRRGEVDEADVEGRLAPRGVAHVGLLGVGGDEDARSGTRGPRDAPRGHPAYRGLRPGPAY